ncbi:gamma-butyrobetaine dioxygenase-like [Watersipora subatra]|uniref:gamma-butyrobetaine dioxygenase-like n=1 Tax=Watersipora subatra TaxID=2589382 RepID=UPI00355C1BA5
MAGEPLSIDLLIGKAQATIKQCEVIEKSRVRVSWSDSSGDSIYPMMLLRDCCPCEKCFSPSVNSRLTLFEQLLAAASSVANISSQPESLCIDWEDGHKSVYEAEWLYRRRLERAATEDRLLKMYCEVQETPWTITKPEEIKTGRYDDILRDPAKIVEFTETLIRDGAYVIKDAPPRHCLVEFLREIKAKHQSTHYSDGEWVIKNIPTSKDLPNSSKKLELHIDMPYLVKPQQLQLLHCLVQSADGGENKLSDALKAALLLKKENPEYYRVLSSVEVDFQFIKRYRGSHDWFICNRAPIIQEDPRTGLPSLCRFAAEVRCSSFNQPVEVIESWYEAFRHYWSILEQHSILIKSSPGDILAFNNGRVMHAREAFNQQQERQLEGIYADWDYLMSAWRVAKCELNRRV